MQVVRFKSAAFFAACCGRILPVGSNLGGAPFWVLLPAVVDGRRFFPSLENLDKLRAAWAAQEKKSPLRHKSGIPLESHVLVNVFSCQKSSKTRDDPLYGK